MKFISGSINYHYLIICTVFRRVSFFVISVVNNADNTIFIVLKILHSTICIDNSYSNKSLYYSMLSCQHWASTVVSKAI